MATSDAPATSAKGDAEQFMIGDEIDIQAATAFRIAPRIYVLSQATASVQSPAGETDSPGAIADLPLHLVFRESAPGDRLRQCWVSDGDANWRWLLAVEQQGESVVATLTAEAPRAGGGNGRLVWRANGAWESFGQNIMNPDPAGTAGGPLIVRAP